MNSGIVGYGVYIPRFRIKRDEYLKAWGSFSPRGVEEKAVAGLDEDAVTMTVESSVNALRRAGISSNQLTGMFFASTSAPYAEKLSSSTIVASLDGPSEIFLADLSSSTKAGTAALLSCLDFISSGRGDVALVGASDVPQAASSDPLEHGLGAGSASFVTGRKDIIASVEGAHCSSLEIIGERYRRYGERYLKDSGIGAYTEQAFNQALTISVTGLFTDLGVKAEEFAYVIFQQFDGRIAYDIGRKLGFKDSQISASMTVTKIGDSGCASPLIGLCAVLDIAEPRDRILVASYGSGSGSDAISLVTTDQLVERRNRAPSVEKYLAQKEYVDYLTYLKFRRMLGARL
jgi:hydroxymethylglutaryl-CoA synthase